MTIENKKLVAKLTAIAILAGGISYDTATTKKNFKVNEKLQNVVETFNEDTKLDEAAEKNIATYKNMSIVEAADYLEESIDIEEKLENYDFSEVTELDKLTKEEYDFAETLTKEDVFVFMEVINSENEESLELQETRLKAIKMLEHLKATRENWIKENGKQVILKTLSWTIKSSVAEGFGLGVEEIDNIKIPKLKKVQDMNFYVLYNEDKIYMSGKSDMFNAFYYYYQIKSSSDLQGEENKIYNEALNSAKVLTMTGVNVENNKIYNIRSLKEAKKVLKK